MSTPTDEARELAAEWIRLDPCDDSCGEKCIAAANRERLLTWVLEYAREAINEGLDAEDVAGNLAIELNLGDGDTFDERAARDLLRAAGWPS